MSCRALFPLRYVDMLIHNGWQETKKGQLSAMRPAMLMFLSSSFNSGLYLWRIRNNRNGLSNTNFQNVKENGFSVNLN